MKYKFMVLVYNLYGWLIVIILKVYSNKKKIELQILQKS